MSTDTLPQLNAAGDFISGREKTRSFRAEMNRAI